jgi:hypothetical protein
MTFPAQIMQYLPELMNISPENRTNVNYLTWTIGYIYVKISGRKFKTKKVDFGSLLK